MQIGEAYRKKIQGKRILLLDNFLTWGYSTESGRTLLLAAGAVEVVIACVSKYGPRINVITPPDVTWDPFYTPRPPAATFRQVAHRGVYHPEVLEEFAASLEGVRTATW
jgi:hypothetical protein